MVKQKVFSAPSKKTLFFLFFFQLETFYTHIGKLFMNHDEAVTKHFLEGKNMLENTEECFWDDIFREKPYFEYQTHPVYQPNHKGEMKGEFDILLVNYDSKVMLYKEVKTNPGHQSYAREQLERAENHFSDWTVIGYSVVE
jgi:hypothetical protein